MSSSATLPIAYDRSFSLHLYWVSHGLLLLRSGKTNKHPSRIDILFSDVRWMALPVWFEGIRVERGEPSDIPLALTAKIKEEAHFMTVFRVTSQGVTHCLLAGDGVRVVEDQQDYSADSSLLPNFDFRAFVAPLWTKAQPGAPPNGGPATPVGKPGVTEGPPSVS
jgi:hypothetical protein